MRGEKWVELFMRSFRRSARELKSLQAEHESLISFSQNLESQTSSLRQQMKLLEESKRKCQEQIEQQLKKKNELADQVDRRNRRIEELEERVSKQQGVFEKLTKRLETVQEERDEVYKQYNRILERIPVLEESTCEDRIAVSSGEEPVGAGARGDWRLNMGCGKVKKAGYVNADIDIAVRPDLVFSLEAALPFASNSFVLIEAYHVIEHVYPWLGIDILKELWRILAPEGKLAIECPNIESACGWLVQNADYGFLSQMGMWPIYGDPNLKNPLHMHKWGYTPITLTAILKEAGFVSIRREVPQTHIPARDFRITAIKPPQNV